MVQHYINIHINIHTFHLKLHFMGFGRPRDIIIMLHVNLFMGASAPS